MFFNDADSEIFRLKYANRPFNVYVGSSNIQQPGFVSYQYSELDLTDENDFFKQFPVEAVDAFFSEHTFEHIEYDLYPIIFKRLFRYLKYGGYFRLALPVYGQNHKAGPLDIKYGHVSYPTSDQLVNFLTQAGFKKVDLLEWVDFSRNLRCSRWFDSCEGRVMRSARLDERNIAFWNITWPQLKKNHFNEVEDFCIPLSDTKIVQSTIIQAQKIK